MSKGTIVYIGGFELPDKNAAAQRVLANASIFRDLGYNIVFIGTSKIMDETGIENPQSVNGYRYYNVFYPKSKLDRVRYLTSISLFKLVLNLYKDTKAILCYNYQACALWKIIRFCKKREIKVIGDTTEWYNPRGNFIYKFIKNLDTSLRMRILQPQLDGLIPTSNFLYDFYKDKNPNLLILPALVDLNDNKWNARTEESDNNIIRFVYAGTTGIGKDELEKALDILSKAKNICKKKISLKIIGMTFEEYCKAFCVLGVPVDIKNEVVFMGRLSHKQVIKEVTNSDFYIFLRNISIVTSAGFPTKFSESISCGTPVITTKTSDLEKYLKEGENGFFIDIINQENGIKKMSMILNIEQDRILQMKNYCKESKIMDYTNFIEATKEFLYKIGV